MSDANEMPEHVGYGAGGLVCMHCGGQVNEAGRAPGGMNDGGWADGGEVEPGEPAPADLALKMFDEATKGGA